MMSLTPRQADVLAFIRQYMSETGGISPTVREIAAGLGLSVKSVALVARWLGRLEDTGHIRRLPNRARAIEILAPVPTFNGKPLQYIPVHALRSAPQHHTGASGP